jgi:hypothetical protein
MLTAPFFFSFFKSIEKMMLMLYFGFACELRASY